MKFVLNANEKCTIQMTQMEKYAMQRKKITLQRLTCHMNVTVSCFLSQILSNNFAHGSRAV